jgi:hypothetical protein
MVVQYLIPWASGSSVPVDRVGLAAHVDLPRVGADSRPPPVSFSPPNAPPISAPLVPMFTLAMPQSLPAWARKRSASSRFCVKIAELRPCGTSLWIAIARRLVERRRSR